MKKLLLLGLVLLLACVSHAKTITGKVTDSTGDPILGATVIVKGTSNNTSTDYDGNYSIEAELEDILVFSFAGYTPVQTKVRQQTVIDITLQESLDAVVVVGYRTTTQKQVSVASNTVTTSNIKKRPNSSVIQKLQGQAAGLQIQNLNGQPGSNTTIHLRGISSINGNTEPLIIIDGVPVDEDSFRAINPRDISSQTVLKDAAGTAIYGNRGANGVILITTNKGKTNYNLPKELKDNYPDFKDQITEIEPQDYETFLNEQYAKIQENKFESTKLAPLSTFSIDVDKASYSNVRRMINNGQHIPPSAVKIEEMVNYFNYEYPQPKDEHPFSINTEVSKASWNKENRVVRIGIQGKEYGQEELPASNLTFLLDVSGSMGSDNKLPLLKKAFGLLVNQMREQDKVSIVVYAGAAGVVLPPTSGAQKETILKALNNLQSGGSTAGGAGIELAYRLAQDNFIKDGNNRVILATDGDFNVGVNSTSDLESMIVKKRKSGVFLSVLGFGYGNYKDEQLETLADKGNGNHAYIDTMQEAQKVFGKEFGGTLYTIAKDVKIQIEFNPALVSSYRLIGYENRLLNDEDFVNDKIDAGELGSGHTVTALYEIAPVNAKLQENQPQLKYQDNNIVDNYDDELFTVKFRYKKPDGKKSVEMIHIQKDQTTKASADMNFATAVALFGMQLRRSAYDGNTTTKDILKLAKKGLRHDPNGYRAEFIRLVESANDAVAMN